MIEAPEQVGFFPSSVITKSDHLCQWQCLSGSIGGGVAGIDAPRNAVELDIDSGDLLLPVDLEEIESLDRQLFASDGGEAPVPDNIIARHKDLDVLSTVESGSVEHTIDVSLLAVGGCGAELSSC